MKLVIPGFVKALLPPGEPPPKGAMGVFSYVDDATGAIEGLKQAGLRNVSIFSPVPYHQIEHAIEQGPSLVRWVTFVGGVAGMTGGLALCYYSVMSWPLVVGGKELGSLPPFMIIGYESMILLGGLFNLGGMLALARLPRISSKAPYDPRFTEDKIGIWVPAVGDDVMRAEQLLRGHGAEEVQVHA